MKLAFYLLYFESASNAGNLGSTPGSGKTPGEVTLAPGSDRIPVELFQILKDDAVESAALNMQCALNMQYADSQQCGVSM